jgi:hypothetical protein
MRQLAIAMFMGGAHSKIRPIKHVQQMALVCSNGVFEKSL